MDGDEPLSEFSLIARLAARLPTSAGTLLGVGDDAAVLAPPKGSLLAAADLMAEGIHFEPAWTPWDALGHKALAINLSDMAAMGAVPTYALVTLALPRDVPEAAVLAMYDGLGALARRFEVAVVGGDTTAARPGALTISVTILGDSDGVEPVRRDGAHPGDLIAVCGALGGAGRALERILGGEAPGPWAAPLLRPEPKVREGRWLAARGIPSAMMDVSDGLLGDLRHILARGRLDGPPVLGARLRPAALPLHPDAGGGGVDPLPRALSGGEDYALLLTLPPSRVKALEAEGAPPVAIIGEITAAPGLSWEGGAPPDLGHPWRHFEQRGAP